MKLIDKIPKPVDAILDTSWMLTALFSFIWGFYKIIFDPHDPNAVVLTILGVIGAGFYKAITKLEKSLAHSNFIAKLSALNNKDAIFVERFGYQLGEIRAIENQSNDAVRKILSERMKELEICLNSYSIGRINVPIDESPVVNHDIIKAFADRMDAVSRNDIEFWSSDLGKDYLRKCTEPNSRAGRATLTRIFIVDKKTLRDPAQVKLLEEALLTHMEKKIGFAIAIEQSLNNIKRTHNIKSNSESIEDAIRLDFALFNNNQAVTFFRNDTGGERRFKAIFNTKSNREANNMLIESQRAVWVDLIGEVWLASDEFVAEVRDSGLSEAESKTVATRSQKDLERLTKKTGHPSEDSWFPLVVRHKDEISEKLRKTAVIFEMIHPE